MRLAGKVALVTGASRGIGKATALALAAEGANVVVNYHSRADAAAEVAAAIHALGRQAITVAADVTNQQHVDDMIARTVQELGGLDILVNNAAIGEAQSISKQTWDEWSKVFIANMQGVYIPTHAAIPHLRARGGGAIVNVSSIAAEYSWRGLSSYAASKGALNAFTRSCALEMARYNIRVNAVAPGMVETEMSEGARERYGDSFMLLIPQSRFAQPEEIASVILFLASDEARYVTGSVYDINGGLKTGI